MHPYKHIRHTHNSLTHTLCVLCWAGEADDREQSKLEEKLWDPECPLSSKQIDQFLVVARYDLLTTNLYAYPERERFASEVTTFLLERSCLGHLYVNVSLVWFFTLGGGLQFPPSPQIHASEHSCPAHSQRTALNLEVVPGPRPVRQAAHHP